MAFKKKFLHKQQKYLFVALIKKENVEGKFKQKVWKSLHYNWFWDNFLSNFLVTFDSNVGNNCKMKISFFAAVTQWHKETVQIDFHYLLLGYLIYDTLTELLHLQERKKERKIFYRLLAGLVNLDISPQMVVQSVQCAKGTHRIVTDV